MDGEKFVAWTRERKLKGNQGSEYIKQTYDNQDEDNKRQTPVVEQLRSIQRYIHEERPDIAERHKEASKRASRHRERELEKKKELDRSRKR